MRKTLLMSGAVLGLAIAAPAFAQTHPYGAMNGYNGASNADGSTTPATTATVEREGGARPGHIPGVGNSMPMSPHASNINRSDTRSDIAPRLPTPPVGENASADQFLASAQRALSRGQTGMAQEALERAETAVLNERQVGNDNGVRGPRVQAIQNALNALGHHDMAGARQGIQEAMSAGGPNYASEGMNGPGMNGPGYATTPAYPGGTAGAGTVYGQPGAIGVAPGTTYSGEMGAQSGAETSYGQVTPKPMGGGMGANAGNTTGNTGGPGGALR